MHLIIKERKHFPLFFLPKYLIGREQKFQHNVGFDWSRNKRKMVDGLFPRALGGHSIVGDMNM